MCEMEVIEEAIFVGANKQSSIMDYNAQEQMVAVGCSNTIGLWRPLASSHKGIFATLKKHNKDVTGVKFVPGSDFIVSIGEDHQVNIWKNTKVSYELYQSLDFHSESVTCLAVINEKIFVTGSADGNVCLWEFNEDDNKVSLSHNFQVKPNFFPLSLAIQDIDEFNNYILAVSGTNNNIYIFSFNLDEICQTFLQSAVLSGHEDWVKCLSFVCDLKNKSYILASGSQDRYIRLWRLKLNELIDNSDEDETKLILLSNKQHKFEMSKQSHGAFSFEAMIVGHDDWVTGLQWSPNKSNKLQLLSSSADTALMVWEMDPESGIWCCNNRLGEMSIKGASTATGASGGFWSCIWFIDPVTNCNYILANGKTGSVRVYKSTDENSTSFESILGITGSNKEVTDIVWSKDGKYFFATSLDQTTRLYARWNKDRIATWHEFARPQIHGYDMVCLDNLSQTKFVSGGDEKVLRVFEMTNSISKLLKNLCQIDVSTQEELPESASLPVLGLSNKAANEQLEAGESIAENDNENEEVMQDKEDVIANLTCPPFEDHLQRYTLFPEIEKLYGHGYEITCTATNPNGTLIASACRSNSAKHAVIRIFNTANEYQLSSQVLEGHNLTITSLEFSPDGEYLLSVSRDRQFSLWRVKNESIAEFELVQLNPKAHSRIIWDCSWAPLNTFGKLFFTVSRDKQIKVWNITTSIDMVGSLKFNEPVTSVSCYNHVLNRKLLVAVGFESGNISLLAVNLTDYQITTISDLDTLITPASRISKLSFSSEESEATAYLSVGSNDTSVRVYSVSIAGL